MSTIFSKIVAGEIPAHVVAETVEYLAFMDVQPLVKGHVLIIPKVERDYIFDMEEDLYVGLWMFAKVVAKGLKVAFPCKKVAVSVIGLEVPHAHIHLIPMNQVGDMNFSKEKLSLSQEELAESAEKIKAALREI